MTYPIMLLYTAIEFPSASWAKFTWGVHIHVHFWGVPLLCSPLGVPCDLSHNALIYQYRIPSASWAKFTWGSSSMFTSRGSDVTYAIMLLYTTIECPSASWAKFKIHMGPPPQELNRLTDRQTQLKTLPSRTLRMRAVIIASRFTISIQINTV